MTWVRAFPAAELSETSGRRFEYQGRSVCVGLADGQPHAVDDRCPHRAADLSAGLVTGGVITCPGHFRRFDLRSGRCVGVPSESVRHYECAVVDGWVQVDLEPAGPSPSLRETLLAHARGQTSTGPSSS
ncbi:MAG TPA: Rieske (2Fe-2S) protein [Streptosporangiaceae bacterium]|nr:Rieske (2Fe-2S) protein [Streptosporangiaceae bacterium]